jgi:CheY-like chemotaxis protein
MAKQVLVVDDVLVNRKLAVAMFAKLGWQSVDVSGGTAALEWLAVHRPDMVLLDISMPDLCGEEVCTSLRARPDLDGMPIVAYTAHAMQVDIDRFLANGFSGVLIKPTSFQALKDVVERLMPA